MRHPRTIAAVFTLAAFTPLLRLEVADYISAREDRQASLAGAEIGRLRAERDIARGHYVWPILSDDPVVAATWCNQFGVYRPYGQRPRPTRYACETFFWSEWDRRRLIQRSTQEAVYLHFMTAHVQRLLGKESLHFLHLLETDRAEQAGAPWNRTPNPASSGLRFAALARR